MSQQTRGDNGTAAAYACAHFEALMLLFAVLVACAPTDSADSSSSDGCVAITPGTDWAWRGECPQMTTPVDVAVDGCALALDYAQHDGMTMGMPYAGDVSGDTVTFGAGDTVTGCVGTVRDADHVEGTCDGGCTFTLSR